MKIKLSMIYLGIYMATLVTIGIIATVIGDPFTAPVIFSILGILGTEIIVLAVILENKMSFMELDKEPDITPKPVIDHTSKVKEYIVNGLKEKYSFKSLLEALQRTGYPNEVVENAINQLEAQGLIKINQPENVPPEPPKKKEEKKKVKKKK